VNSADHNFAKPRAAPIRGTRTSSGLEGWVRVELIDHASRNIESFDFGLWSSATARGGAHSAHIARRGGSERNGAAGPIVIVYHVTRSGASSAVGFPEGCPRFSLKMSSQGIVRITYPVARPSAFERTSVIRMDRLDGEIIL